jgi:hypothetical protein
MQSNGQVRHSITHRPADANISLFIHSFQVSQRHYIKRHGIFCKIQSGPNIIRLDSSHDPRSNPSRRGH